MSDIIASEKIMATKAYKKADPFMQNLVIKRANREKIHHAIIVYNTTGKIDSNLSSINEKIFKEILKIN